MHCMPHTYWDIYRHILTSRFNDKRIGANPFKLIIILHPKFSSQAHHRFRCLLMPMNGQLATRLNGIQHSLASILSRIPKIMIHSSLSDAFDFSVNYSNTFI